jgi:hypothetical protein
VYKVIICHCQACLRQAGLLAAGRLDRTIQNILKILFKMLDYLISVFMGAGTVFVVSLIVGEGWNMFIAMIAGMVLGMFVLLLTVMLFVYVSSAFELFHVGMVITMLVGMISGMAMAVGKADFTRMLCAAIILSVLAQLCMDLLNMKLKGEVTVDK